jgi:hypothetical protein
MFRNLGLDHHGSAGGTTTGAHDSSGQAKPAEPSHSDGGIRPTLGLPPQHHNTPDGEGARDPERPTQTPSDNAPPKDDHQQYQYHPPVNPNPTNGGGTQPTTPSSPTETPVNPAPGMGGDPVGIPTPSTPPSSPPSSPTDQPNQPPNQPTDAPPTPAGDDGSWQPAMPAPPLTGDGSYDLLKHGAPAPTPITDAMSPATPSDGASFNLPAAGDADGVPAPAQTGTVQSVLPSGSNDPQPALSTLPEPSVGLVALVAGMFGLARRHRANHR